MEIVIEHSKMVGNRQECHGKAGERWRRSEKIRYMTVGDFVIVMSGLLRETMGWVERIDADTVYLFEYKEKGNVSNSSDNIKVSFILIPAHVLIH